jgi:superfamily II DNA or RNA helicase
VSAVAETRAPAADAAARTYGTYQYRPEQASYGPGKSRGYWELTIEPGVATRVKRIFGRISVSRTGVLTIADTPEVARDLQWMHERWPMLPADDLSEKRLRDGADHHRATEQAVARILKKGARTGKLPLQPAKEARDYQLVAVELLRATGRLLLTDSVGLGKTYTAALGAVHEDALPMLVVPPTHLPGRWLQELEESFPWLTTGVAQKTTLPKDWAPDQIPDVFIVPYSRLAGWAPHLHGHIKTVIFDEVQDLRKGVETQKGKAAAHVCDSATYVQGMSATPLFNYGGEIWNIYDIIAPGELGTKDEFTREWGRPMQNGGIHVTDPAALGSYLREQALMLGRTREEVGRELPETIKVSHTVNSDPAALNAVKGDAVAMAKLILADTTTRQQRMQAAGELDWKLRQATGIGKAPYVAEFCRMLLESEDKIILAGWHRAVYELWNELLADFKPAMYTGSESPAQKTASEKAFIEGDSRILIMSLRSGSGLDGLQKVCGVSVFGELDWSPQVHEQLIGRTRRDGMGSKPPVAYFLNSAEGSDPAVMEALGIKRQQSEPMLSKDGKVFATAMPETGRGRLLAEQILGLRKAAA